MSGEDLAVAITAVAIYTAQYLSVTDLNILVAVFTQLADTYATISVIRSLESENPDSSTTKATATQQQEETIVALETT